MPSIGKSIELYLMDGTASGRWQAILSNWNCYAYKINRGDLKDCSDIPELEAPGVYFLFGRDDESGREFVYVGEADNVVKRVLQPHNFEKDGTYWKEVVAFITPDGSLDKARIKYLENRFYSIATETERYIVKNKNTPTQSTVQKKVRDTLEEFIINARLVMIALGHKVFEPLASENVKESEDKLLYLSRNKGAGGEARGKIDDDGFWVFKGSYIYPKIADYLASSVVNSRKQYEKYIDKNGKLQIDICFGSPSYAASFVFGKSANGLIEWKDKNGKTLKELNGGFNEPDKKEKKTRKSKDSMEKDSIHIDPDVSEEKMLHLAGKRIAAYAFALEDCFLVKKGSGFSDNETESCEQSIRNYRKKLIEDGDVSEGLFVHDVRFNSPSMAAACILGRSVNGRTAWLNKDGKTLKELQESRD